MTRVLKIEIELASRERKMVLPSPTTALGNCLNINTHDLIIKSTEEARFQINAEQIQCGVKKKTPNITTIL